MPKALIKPGSEYRNKLQRDNNLRLYGRLGYRVDREEVHPQLGMAVYMSKHLPAHGADHTPAPD